MNTGLSLRKVRAQARVFKSVTGAFMKRIFFNAFRTVWHTGTSQPAACANKKPANKRNVFIVLKL